MNWFTLIVAALATWHIVEVWRHGEIFATWRARVECWEPGFFQELLMCPFCLSVWVAGATTAWLMIAAALGYDFIAWPLYLFAAARLANLGNDVTHPLCRTPRQTFEIPEAGEDDGDGTQKVVFGTQHMSKDEDMLRKAEALDETEDPRQQQMAMEGKVPGKTFDIQLIELLRPTLVEAFQKHGDMLRSVGIFFDYYGGLNETPNIQKGMWLGPEGPVKTPDAVIGSLQGGLVLLQEILGRAFEMEAKARENLTILLGEIKTRSEEYEQLEEKIREAKGQLGQSQQGEPDSAGT